MFPLTCHYNFEKRCFSKSYTTPDVVYVPINLSLQLRNGVSQNRIRLLMFDELVITILDFQC